MGREPVVSSARDGETLSAAEEGVNRSVPDAAQNRDERIKQIERMPYSAETCMSLLILLLRFKSKQIPSVKI
jgi:hypothetical protein